ARSTRPVARLRAIPVLVGLLLGLSSLAWIYASLLDVLAARAGHITPPDSPPFRIDKRLDSPRFRRTGESLLYREVHQAQGYLEDALRQDPRNATLWLRLAQSYFYAGDPDRGSRAALRSLQLAPTQVPIHLEQAAMAVDFWSQVDPHTREQWDQMVQRLYAEQAKGLARYLHSIGKLPSACAVLPALNATLLCPGNSQEAAG
ncbi:MAG: hypothetical protein ACPHCJ_13385, partial [Oceanococcaceae bacterium]